VDRSARKLLVMTGADIEVGRTDAEEMAIVRDDQQALVAVQITSRDSDVYIVRLDKKTGNAVWGKVGEFLFGGQVAWAHYLECR
jgi:hypothetical protein